MKQLKHLIQQSTQDMVIGDKLRELFEPTKFSTDLDYLQPFRLADHWQLDRRAVLESFVRGCQVGLFALHWQ